MQTVKTQSIGIIGGISPESTASYYLHITRSFHQRYNRPEFPSIYINSLNMAQLHRWRENERWDLIIDELAAAADNLLATGANFGLIANNTMHKVFEQVQSKTRLPLINLMQVTSNAVNARGIKKVALLGTSFTMSENFYANNLESNGLTVLVPENQEQQKIHNIIMSELIRGQITESSRNVFKNIISNLIIRGAQGIILGCTEIPLLISGADVDVPIFDTSKIHADSAIEWSLS